MQENLVDSAFGLLCPFQETVLTVNTRNFVMILLSIEDPTIQKEDSAYQIPEEEKRLSQLIRQSYTMPFDDVSQEEEQWTTVSQKDFVGVRDQFYTFVYNRTCNLKEYARQKAQLRAVEDVTFAPQINRASNQMANELMQRYWQKDPKQEPKTEVEIPELD